MYYIRTVTAHAPSSGGGKYRRPIHIRVVRDGQRWMGPGYQCVAEWRNVDARYRGPRSACGKAFAEAHKLCDELNAQEAIAELVAELAALAAMVPAC